MDNLKKDTHCSYCGEKFGQVITYPRQCLGCKRETYSNPLPCAVVFIPVWDGEKNGNLIQKRGIEPKRGQWALSGGYMNNMETWQQTAAREVYEEIGLQSSPEDYKLIDVRTSPSNGNLLMFCYLANQTPLDEVLDVFVPNEEVLEIRAIYEPEALAFPIQTEMLYQFMGVKL